MNNLLDQLHAALLSRNVAEIIKIAEQIDGEHQGGKIVELPCKVGDTVYNIASKLENGSSRMIYYPSVVRKITFTESGAVYFYAGDWPFSLEDINKNVYLSSTAAEQALKERET